MKRKEKKKSGKEKVKNKGSTEYFEKEKFKLNNKKKGGAGI